MKSQLICRRYKSKNHILCCELFYECDREMFNKKKKLLRYIEFLILFFQLLHLTAVIYFVYFKYFFFNKNKYNAVRETKKQRYCWNFVKNWRYFLSSLRGPFKKDQWYEFTLYAVENDKFMDVQFLSRYIFTSSKETLDFLWLLPHVCIISFSLFSLYNSLFICIQSKKWTLLTWIIDKLNRYSEDYNRVKRNILFQLAPMNKINKKSLILIFVINKTIIVSWGIYLL